MAYYTGTGGDDSLHGGKTDDELTGGLGNDLIDGNEGIDTAVMSGKAADYTVSYDSINGQYILSGPDGEDRLMDVEYVRFDSGTVAVSALYTGAGGGTPGDDYNLRGGSGNDSLQGLGGTDYIYGEAGDDTIEGGDGQNVMYGGEGNDLMYGGPYMDQFNGGPGDDTFIGGSGDPSYDHDRVFYNDAAAGIHASLLTGIATGDGTDSLSGIDHLDGSEHADYFEGNDQSNGLWGAGGNDTLIGGAGDDGLMGDAGDDSIDGGEGSDTAAYFYSSSSVSVDLASGTAQGVSSGTDTLTGIEHVYTTSFDDAVIGTDGANRIETWEGDDTIEGGGGDDTVWGLDGTDTVIFTGSSADYTVTYGSFLDVWTSGGRQIGFIVTDTVADRDGTDTLVGAEYLQFSNGTFHYTDLISGGSAPVSLEGSAGDDSLAGGSGNDSLYGGKGGNDTLDGRGGDDYLNGDVGSDTAVYRGDRDEYTVTLNGDGSTTIADTVADRDGTDTVRSVEFFQFADGTLGAGNLFQGPPLEGTSGNDSIEGSSLAEWIGGLAGNDRLVGNDGNDSLEGDAGNDTLMGGAGSDTAYYDDVAGNLTVNLGLSRSQDLGSDGRDTLVSIENVVTGAGNDSIVGNADGNILQAGSGNDTLSGGAGADSLYGGKGNDTYIVDGLDTVDEAGGSGVDKVLSSADVPALWAGIENVTLTGNALLAVGNAGNNVLVGNAAANTLNGEGGNDEIVGGSGNDVLSGGEGDDVLDGQSGADAMYGGKGNDTYYVDSAADVVYDSEGTADTVYSAVNWSTSGFETIVLKGRALTATGDGSANTIVGTSGNNMLDGAGGADVLRGEGGSDVLYGGKGNDWLAGGQGADSLVGGEGADTFHFASALARNSFDRIADFDAALDGIELDNAVFRTLVEGELSAGAFQAGATSIAANGGVRVIFNTTTGALFYDADGSGRTAATQFAQIELAGLSGSLSAADFVVV